MQGKHCSLSFPRSTTQTLYDMVVSCVTRIIQAHIVRLHPSRGESPRWEHLVLRRSPTQTHFPNMWQVVTGTIDNDETPLRTAFREIEEETGICADKLWVLPHVGTFYDAERNAMNLVPCFAAIFVHDSSEVASVHISSEHTAFEWHTKEEVQRQLVIPSHIQGVEVLERHILPLLERGEEPVFAKHHRSECA
ncbi:MAG: NUDIX domain-containing protein [Candidatus Kapaibacterium sp.]|nr:MAG: NUDIX domain-containing protein [Candidatus Kapabacteria bacterium]